MKFIDRIKKYSPYEQIKTLKKAVNSLKTALRPGSGAGSSYLNYVVPRYPWPLETLYEVSYYSDILSIVQKAIKREIFRNGYEIVAAEMTDAEVSTAEDDVAVSDDLIRQELEWAEDVNENHQSIIDVAQEMEDDLNIIDDAYAFFHFDYTYDNEAGIKDFDLREVLRMDPKFMGLVMNDQDRPGFNNEGVPLLVCPEHRENLLEGAKRCPQCGKKTYKAYYRHKSSNREVHYFRHEVFHQSRYRPSKRLGFSPVMTVWAKVFSLYSMDDYIKELYSGKRPPKGMLVFNTSNYASLKKSWEDMLFRAKENPHLPAIMGIENMGKSGPKKIAEFFDFMKTLDELQYTDARQEMRTQIGAVYGVMPVFQADVSQGGGLNNEGFQVTVQNRTVQDGQGDHNKFFVHYLKARQKTGMVMKLRPSEEQDEAAKLDRTYKSLLNGQLAVEMGLDAMYDPDTGEVVISKGPLQVPEGGSSFPNMSGGFGTSGAPSKPEIATKQEVLKAQRRPKFTKLADVLKNEIDEFIKKYKRKPTEKELEGLITRIEQGMAKSLKESASKFFDKTYLAGIKSVESDLGLKIGFGSVDDEALNALKNQKVLAEAYKDLTKVVTSNIHDVIREAYRDPKGLSSEAILEKIKESSDVADYRAETIARTETSKVSAAARRNSYKKADPNDEFLYQWIGPDDRRTTKTSKRIKARIGKGVRWDELVKIVIDESSKDFPDWNVDKDFPVSHYNSRHVFIRVQS